MRIDKRALVGGIAAVVWLGQADQVRGQTVGAGAGAATGDEVVVIDATRGRDLDESQLLRVRVRNSALPSRAVVVSVIDPTRPEYVLGFVPPGATREFVIDTRSYVGGVRFLARSGPRGENLVNRVQAVGNSRATWDLGLNFMKFERLEKESADR
jgi:hypothetical protein